MTKLELADRDWHRVSAQVKQLHCYFNTIDAITDALIWVAVGIVLSKLL